ncbi:MAG TPA: GNAT family N-acetyltransferase [Pyrinomonadaceae bacterium]|nr:GNAT family N-acetyltransferase [Pyrinomonadaceae bacterium]
MFISFRQLGKGDALLYRKIRLECLKNFPDNFGSTFEEESFHERLKFEIFLTEENTDNFMFGAFDGETLIGICGFSREPRSKARHRGEIVQMYVNPAFAGQNIGFDLLQKTIEKALVNSEIEQIVLSVVAENKSANKLYEKIGFVQYGFITNYFKQGEKYWNQRFMVLER